MEEQSNRKRNRLIVAACAAVAITAAVALTISFGRGTSSDTTARQPAPPQITYTQPAPEPEVAAEPEKTPEQLMTEADQELAAKDYESAVKTLDELYEHTNVRTLTAVPMLLKQGDAHVGIGDYDGARPSYKTALSVLERTYGPLDQRVLPALSALIADYDDTGALDDSDRLIDRYQQISHPATMVDSTSDEAAVEALVTQAQERATKNSSCLCDELSQSIEEAGKQYGPRSYVVALLWLKQAEVADADDKIDAVDANQLYVVMSIIEQRFSPTDMRLKPVLNRLIAIHDDAGEHEAANLLVKRVSLLDAVPAPAK